VGAELFHAKTQTDRHYGANSRFSNALKTRQKRLVTAVCIRLFINRTTFSPNLDKAVFNCLLYRLLLKKFGPYYDYNNNNNYYRNNHSKRKYYPSLKLTQKKPLLESTENSTPRPSTAPCFTNSFRAVIYITFST
jgi:hypothetical protein